MAPRRVKAFAKRLLQVAAQQGACFAAGALFLVSEVMKAKPGLRMLLQQGEVREPGRNRALERYRRDRVSPHINSC